MRIVTLILVKIAILVDFGTGLGASYRPERLCQWLHRYVNEYFTVKRCFKLQIDIQCQLDIAVHESLPCLSPTQHTDIEPEPAASELRGALQQDVRGPPWRVLLLGATGLRRHRREETRAQAGHGWEVCACKMPGFSICS